MGTSVGSPERFVETSEQLQQRLGSQVLGPQHRVIGSELAGHTRRDRRFVDISLGERHRERADGRAAVAGQERDQQGRVDAAGQKGADRHVTDHLALDRTIEQLFQFLLIWRRRGRIGQGRAPIAIDARLGIAKSPFEAAAGLELANASQHGARGRNVVERHQIANGVQIERLRIGQHAERLER